MIANALSAGFQRVIHRARPTPVGSHAFVQNRRGHYELATAARHPWGRATMFTELAPAI